MSKVQPENEGFKEYRKRLGFTSQADLKSFFSAKDIDQGINLAYIEKLNGRLHQIVDSVNKNLHEDMKIDDLEQFKAQYITIPFDILKSNGILPRLNNLGRRPESVYYSWMRGYVVSNMFIKALSEIFGVKAANVSPIGADDLQNIKTFRKTPRADFEIKLNDKEKVRIEVQSGFQGMNDIKKHKVQEAKKVFKESGTATVLMHIDLYNGQVAFVRLHEIPEDSISWVARQQMEGQLVFEIEQKHFVWKISEKPKKLLEMMAASTGKNTA